MDTELMLDVGQANEIKLAARRAGATNADLKRLSEGDMFSRILPILRGNGVVHVIRHPIDCDARPFTPNSLTVHAHIKGGCLEWNPAKSKLLLSPLQMDGKVIDGNNLRRVLAETRKLNANVLDYLLLHPDLIPEEWKKDSKGNCLFTHFWGTIYRNLDGDLFVRYIFFIDGGWVSDIAWLGDTWDDNDPAATLKA